MGSRFAPQTERAALGGLVPRTERAALGGLSLTSTEFHDFRTHEPRITIDGLSASSGRLVARGSASIVTAKSRTARGPISPAADTVFTSTFAIPTEGGKGSVETLAATTTVAPPTSLSRRSTSGDGLHAATTGLTVSASAPLGTPAPPSTNSDSNR